MTKKKLLRFKLEDGSEFYIEGMEHSAEELKRTSKKKDSDIIDIDEKFESLITKIRPVSELLLTSFKDFNTPNNIELEFGIKFGAKAGIIFASADSEATFKITLKWN